MGPTRWKEVRGKWAPCHMHQEQVENKPCSLWSLGQYFPLTGPLFHYLRK